MMELDDIRSGVGFFKEFVDWVHSLINKEKRKYLGAIRAIHNAARNPFFIWHTRRQSGK